MRRPNHTELEQTVQIHDGLLRLREFLTESHNDRHSPAIPALLAQEEDVVKRWTSQLENYERRVSDWPFREIPDALSTLHLTIENQWAFRNKRQNDLLRLADDASENSKVLLLALLNIDIADKEATRIIEIARDYGGLTLQEAIWLILLSRRFPEEVGDLGKLLCQIRASDDESGAERLLSQITAQSADLLRQLLDDGAVLAEKILAPDELERRLQDAIGACDSVLNGVKG